MEVQGILVELVDLSEFNTRRDLADGQFDTTIEPFREEIQQTDFPDNVAVVNGGVWVPLRAAGTVARIQP